MRLVLGNRHATDSEDNGETRVVLPKGKRATVVEVPDEVSLSDAFTAITAPGGVWATHATEGATPAWVASDNPTLAAIVASHFGGHEGPIEVRDLEEDPS
jgi:hypothetical protein